MKAKDGILGILMHESLAEKEAASEGGKGRAGMSLGKKVLKKPSNAAEKQISRGEKTDHWI